jgi:uncharacterized protein (DUF427 family)
VPWYKKHGVRREYFQLSNSKTVEGWESIAKTLSIDEADDEEEEEVWVEQNLLETKSTRRCYCKDAAR